MARKKSGHRVAGSDDVPRTEEEAQAQAQGQAKPEAKMSLYKMLLTMLYDTQLDSVLDCEKLPREHGDAGEYGRWFCKRITQLANLYRVASSEALTYQASHMNGAVEMRDLLLALFDSGRGILRGEGANDVEISRLFMGLVVDRLRDAGVQGVEGLTGRMEAWMQDLEDTREASAGLQTEVEQLRQRVREMEEAEARRVGEGDAARRRLEETVQCLRERLGVQGPGRGA
jgi:hypothetical protein